MEEFKAHKPPFVMLANKLAQDPNISLTAKGLAAYMFSMPHTWKFSVRGLMSQTNEGQRGIQRAIKELIDNGYLKRTAVKDERGKISFWRYELFFCPDMQNEYVENAYMPNVNNNKETNKEINNSNKEGEAPPTIQFAEYVFMTSVEHQKLVALMGKRNVDYYIEAYNTWKGKGETAAAKRSKNPYLTIRSWYNKDKKEHPERFATKQEETLDLNSFVFDDEVD